VAAETEAPNDPKESISPVGPLASRSVTISPGDILDTNVDSPIDADADSAIEVYTSAPSTRIDATLLPPVVRSLDPEADDEQKSNPRSIEFPSME
jgi:hypothetical protein